MTAAPKTKKPTAKTATKKATAEKPTIKAVAKKAVDKKPAAKTGEKTRKPGVGALIKELILKNKETEAILEAVIAKFPEAATTANNVSWYRTKLRADGLLK